MKILIIVVSFKRICKKTGDGRVCFLCDILHILGFNAHAICGLQAYR